MTEYVERKRILSPDGMEAVTLEEGDHGLCRFSTWKLYDPAPDIPQVSGLTWTVSGNSGLFASLAEVEAAAATEIPWLRA